MGRSIANSLPNMCFVDIGPPMKKKETATAVQCQPAVRKKESERQEKTNQSSRTLDSGCSRSFVLLVCQRALIAANDRSTLSLVLSLF